MSERELVEFESTVFDVKSGALLLRAYLGDEQEFASPFLSTTDGSLTPPYREPTPQLQISMTDACNLGCTYCSFRDRIRADGKPVNMPDATAAKAIEFFRANIPSHYTTARIDFGLAGEPLLRQSKHADLVAAVEAEFATGNFEAVWTGTNTTNATLLKEDPALSLFGPPMDISMDGPKDIHDRHRKYVNGTGSFDDVAMVAKQALAKYPSTSCSTVLTADGPDFLAIFRFLTEEIGFNDIYMKPVNSDRTVKYGLNEETLEIFKSGYTALIEYIVGLDDRKKLEVLRKFNAEDYFMRFFRRLKHSAKEIYRCGAGKSGVYVDTNGKLYPCAHFIGKTGWHIGTLEEGFYDDKVQEYFSLTVDSREPCKSCWARYLCGGGCYYQAALANNRLDQPDAVKCDLIRHICELAAQLLHNLATNSPAVLYALPASLCIPPEYLGADPNDIYHPKSVAVFAEPNENVARELENMSSVEGRLWEPDKSLALSLANDDQFVRVKVTATSLDFDSVEIDIFDIEKKPFKFMHLKSPQAAYQPRRVRLERRGNGWELVAVLGAEKGAVRRIPYVSPLLEVVEEARAIVDLAGVEILVPRSTVFLEGAETVGLSVRVVDRNGVTSLVRYEPFFELSRALRGDIKVKSPEYLRSDASEALNTCPVPGWAFIDAWGAIRNNVC